MKMASCSAVTAVPLASCRSRLAGGLAAFVALACAASCGGGRPESPESLAREVFEAIRDGNEASFLAKQAQDSDYLRLCPGMTAQDKSEASVELGAARVEAMKGYSTCRDLVRFDGAEFLSATRNPTEGVVVNLRFHGCASTLSFPAMRVLFTRNGVRGNIYIEDVTDMEGRWVHRSGVRLCEQSVPQ